MNSNFEEIFQGWLEKEEYNKNKGFLKKTKYWKKYFCVLRRYEGDANVYLQWFEKEEEWRKEFPKGSFGLFPKYSVYKHKMEKGKNHFEVSNDEEAHYFLANNEKTMDLWVIQLMMQTRLSGSMIETSYRVKGGENKDLQRIGAKNLNCLVHLSEWGITLALERTHSVLSQWPLTTIRNYECTDNNEFVFEAGRKSPMGEGKYVLVTTNSEDNLIFDQLDHFTSLRARRVRSAGGRNRLDSANDYEIAQAYGQLRWSVMLTSSQLNLGVMHAMPSQPQAIVRNNQGVYNQLDRRASIQTASTVMGESYDRLDHTGSFSDRLSWERSYSRLNCNSRTPTRTQSERSKREQISNSYDHLERAQSFTGSPSSADGRSRSFGSFEGGNRFQAASPPPEDSYNHLTRYRHASLPSSNSPKRQMDFYDKLDRSMASVNQWNPAQSYDRLDNMQDHAKSYDRLNSMQGSMVSDRDTGLSPPPSSNDPNAYDTFGNLKEYTPTQYNFVAPGQGINQEPLVVELPPPLPEKPSFMSRGEKKATSVEAQSSASTNSPTKRNKPLPPRPDLNDQPEATRNENNEAASPVNGVDAVVTEANPGTHYQAVDDENAMMVNGNNPGGGNAACHYQTVDEEKMEIENDPALINDSHYQAIDDQKMDPEYTEPRGRLNTHSSNPDLTKILEQKGKLEPRKRTTIHRSMPSLAQYSLVDKKSKGSPKLAKSGSTFKLFKKIGRHSKKAEESYEKVPRKSKKKDKTESASSLKRLVPEDEAVSYVDIDGEESTLAKNLMERRDSKRPLPDLPPLGSADV